jgi:6-phosphogluconolactonase
MSHPLLEICTDADALAARAAALVTTAASDAIRDRGRFTFVLAGGSTPAKTYTLLAEPARRAAIDWSKVFIFFGDERFVPPDDPASNYGMARRTLLSQVPIPAAQVFAVPTLEKTPTEAAAAYSRALAQFFKQVPESAPPPRFDLVLLGLGDDGHTASLFPDKAAAKAEDRWVTFSPPGVLPPPVDRITFTFPVLNAARQVAFLVAGENKADVLQEILEGNPGREKFPAAGIAPVEGTLTWLLDQTAASRLLPRPGFAQKL